MPVFLLDLISEHLLICYEYVLNCLHLQDNHIGKSLEHIKYSSTCVTLKNVLMSSGTGKSTTP